MREREITKHRMAIVEEGIKKPKTRFKMPPGKKYQLDLLVKKGQSIFIPLGDKEEHNLKQNLFQHVKRMSQHTGGKYSIHKDMKDGMMGFRVWLDHVGNKAKS